MYKPWKSPLPSPAETKPDLSVRGLIRWLETQDGAKTYRWCGGGVEPCLGAQFVMAVTGEKSMSKVWNTYGLIPVSVRVDIFAIGEQTFSAALERARAYLRERGDD